MRAFHAYLFVTLIAASALATVPVFPRHPAPSPDGTRIAFSWQGDIWLAEASGGPAHRVTANPGYDHSPLWLAGGQALAFVSDREGSDDVFVVDLDGGVPRRLTYHEANDAAQGQLGGDVVLVSRRHEAWDRAPAIYRVPLEGGTERLAARVLALEAVPSPDGQKVALVRGGTPADRRHYRGSANRDLWLLDLASGSLERLTETPFDEDGVSWAGNRALIYRTDNGGEDRNLFRLDLATRRATQLTHHVGADVRAPRASQDGRVVAYELWDSIWLVPTDGSRPPRRLEVEVPADVLDPLVRREKVRSDAEEVVPSPDGSQVALVVRGDVFVVQRRSKELASVAEAPTVQVTDTPARELDLAWSPDGTRLYYASDRGGQYDLYLARPDGRDDARFYRAVAFTETRLTATPEDERSPLPSPDGVSLAWTRGAGDLLVGSADAREPRVLFTHWSRPVASWSPDSRWLAYSREDAWFNNDVFLVAAAGGAEVNVSRHPQDDLGPVWSPDGRRLYWRSKRHANTVDVWYVDLTRADHERSPEEWLQLFEDEKAGKGSGAGDGLAGKDARDQRVKKKGEPREAPAEAKPVVIDLDGIAERARALTELPGDEGEIAVAPDGRTIAFVAEPEGESDLYTVRWDGKELKRLTDGGVKPSQLAFAKDGKSVFYRTGKGGIGTMGLDGKSGDPTPFAAQLTADRAALRAQVFGEAWRELDRNFYDPAFHGQDWKAIRDRYRPLALSASSRRDFDDAMNLMLGELNASHMGFRPPAARDHAATGDLGVELEPAADGRGVRIVEILPETPAARGDAGLSAGDVILAIDGHEIGPRDNVFALLTDTVGQRVRLRVKSKENGGERELALTPVKLADARKARYLQWTRERRALVEAWAGGKLGYIHIQGMDAPSLEEFERELFAAADGKQGLLIDVRNNGGGWTTDVLMAILSVRRHAWTVPRGGDPRVRAYPQDRLPLPAWTRPAATLCDEASYSNAEIFSWAFKTLMRGPVIGMPTFGAVISTGGARLADGSFVRLPGRGWYVAESGVNMEHNGCPPDVVVPQPPEQDLSASDDDQLRRAVEVLLAQLPSDPSRLPW